MTGWSDQLRDDLKKIEAQGLLRHLTPSIPEGRIVHVNGQSLLNLSSNDYLGLARHPRLQDAAIAATYRFGTSASASRLICGHYPVHQVVEQEFARFKHSEAALLFPSGYMANHAVLTTLATKGDLICLDKFTHASLLDAAQASGATTRVYPHLNLLKLERLLNRHERVRRRFIVTDSVFSMDGDTADLPNLRCIADRHDAILVVDEAHATGVLGKTGTGLAELQGVDDGIDITISTASKALGSIGGIITASRVVVDTLINRARSFIYTTAIPANQVAVLGAALDVMRSEPSRRRRLEELATRMWDELGRLDLLPPWHNHSTVMTPIIPIVVGTSDRALALSSHLKSHSVLAPAIRPPTVRVGTSRVRLSLRADLEDRDIDRLCEALHKWQR